MFIFDGCPAPGERIRRENGTWGVFVQSWTVGQGGVKTNEKVLVDECGEFPTKGGVRMPGEMGSVGGSRGLTLNLGNYQSARCDVWLTVPCKADEIDKTYERCTSWINTRLKDEAKKVQEAKEKGEI